jgi:hypothetical protein
MPYYPENNCNFYVDYEQVRCGVEEKRSWEKIRKVPGIERHQAIEGRIVKPVSTICSWGVKENYFRVTGFKPIITCGSRLRGVRLPTAGQRPLFHIHRKPPAGFLLSSLPMSKLAIDRLPTKTAPVPVVPTTVSKTKKKNPKGKKK